MNLQLLAQEILILEIINRNLILQTVLFVGNLFNNSLKLFIAAQFVGNIFSTLCLKKLLIKVCNKNIQELQLIVFVIPKYVLQCTK